MARTLPLRSRRHIAGAGLMLTLALGCAAVVASSAPARAHESTRATDDRVIVCESGVISHGDVDTSSVVAVRVPTGALVPTGCREG